MRREMFVVSLLLAGAVIGQIGLQAYRISQEHDGGDCSASAVIPSDTVLWLIQNTPWDELAGGPPDGLATGPRGASEFDPKQACESFSTSWRGPRTGISFISIDRFPDESVAFHVADDPVYIDPVVEYVDTGTHLENVDRHGKFDNVDAVFQRRCIVMNVVWSGLEGAPEPEVRDHQILPILETMSADLCPALGRE